MSITVTLDENGLDQLADVVCRQFKLGPSSRVKIEVAEDTITLRPVQSQPTEDVPLARIEYRNGFPVIVGAPPVTEAQIIAAIQADRDERDEHLAGYPRRK